VRIYYYKSSITIAKRVKNRFFRMFSVIFPGQGSQMIGMGKEFFEKHDSVKNLFKEADDALGIPLSKIILDGPKDKLDLTVNTQPAIFLISYSIFDLVKKEFGIDLSNAKYFAGHSLGEYSALSCAGYLNFTDTLKLLRTRGDAMQNAVPEGEGGMTAVLGSNIESIEEILKENQNNFLVQIANDNTEGQIVLSGKSNDLIKLTEILKSKSIKTIKLPVSAPFHCKLMNKATEIMKKELEKINFNDVNNILISNVTAEEIKNKEELKKLLVNQIENRVRWRESVVNMINKGVTQFIEIGPGKVLSGLVKRINKNVKINTINSESDIKGLEI
jgi:[acyl-carrier-protein] S-malonyltransferase